MAKTLLPMERSVNTIEHDYWNMIYDARDRNTIITATVIACRRNENLAGTTWEITFNDFAEAENVRGLIPASETGLPDEKMMNFFINKEINIRIKGIDRKNEIVACTRKELVDESKSRLLRRIEAGIEFDAQVVFVTETWLGVDIGGGLVYGFNPTEARVSRSMGLNELYREGQYIKAKINAVDKTNGKIDISLIDPWDNVQYNRGDMVTGTIVRLGANSMFMEIKPGVVGIASYPVSLEPELGDKLVCTVKSIEVKEKLLYLTLFDPEVVRGRKKNRENRGYWQQIATGKNIDGETLVQPNLEPKTEEI